MPHGVLFRGGAEGKIRQALIEQDKLEAVIGLPSNLFYSTSIPACLLIFRAARINVNPQRVPFVIFCTHILLYASHEFRSCRVSSLTHLKSDASVCVTSIREIPP
jgi:type I restriction-modification system DNA methylase subunit